MPKEDIMKLLIFLVVLLSHIQYAQAIDKITLKQDGKTSLQSVIEADPYKAVGLAIAKNDFYLIMLNSPIIRDVPEGISSKEYKRCWKDKLKVKFLFDGGDSIEGYDDVRDRVLREAYARHFNIMLVKYLIRSETSYGCSI